MTPSAPQACSATAGNSMAIVQWQPPSSTGDSSLLSYVVTCSDIMVPAVTVSTPLYGLAPQLQSVFPSLANGTPYTFTVIAVNSDGAGPSSDPSSAVTPIVLPGRLPNVLTLLMAQMAMDYVAYGVGIIPEFQIGGQYIFENSDGPRVVFVIKDGPWTGPTHDGNGVTNPKELWIRRPVVEAHIWGVQLPTADPIQNALSNYGVAEDIANNLAASLQTIAYGSQITNGEQWPSGNARNTSRGAAIVLKMTIEIPATDYMPPTVAVIEFPQTMVVLPN